MTFDFSKKLSKHRLQEFADMLREISSRIGFRVSSRGWCYLLEQAGDINKDQFDKVETWVNRCRRDGVLEIDFVAEESSRAFEGIETPEGQSPIQDLGAWVRTSLDAAELYKVDWWKTETVYVQMVVEKIDLVTLFRPICQEYHIPIANSKGWSSMLQRAEYARRFKEAEERGMQCVLLYCGDHDPAGLMISDFMRKNLSDLSAVRWNDEAEGYDPENLTIERFGLNFDLIQSQGFTWIDNLVTGGGQDLSDILHRHHGMEYVQKYIKKFGARKCEANVLVTQPRVARTLCRTAIERHIGKDAKARFEARRQDVRDYMKKFDDRTGALTQLEAIMRHVEEEDRTMEDEMWDG